MKRFIRLYKKITKDTHMEMLRWTDMEANKKELLETELFEGVEELIVPEYTEELTPQYFDEHFKLNKKSEIFNITLNKYDGFVQEGWYLSIVCKKGTIIKR